MFRKITVIVAAAAISLAFASSALAASSKIVSPANGAKIRSSWHQNELGGWELWGPVNFVIKAPPYLMADWADEDMFIEVSRDGTLDDDGSLLNPEEFFTDADTGEATDQFNDFVEKRRGRYVATVWLPGASWYAAVAGVEQDCEDGDDDCSVEYSEESYFKLKSPRKSRKH